MHTSFDPARFDPVTPVHKAMRRFMFQVLTQIGALDAGDIFEIDHCAKQVARLAGVMPGTAETLSPLLDALHQRDPGARHIAASHLYRELTKLVSEQLTAQMRLEDELVAQLQAAHVDPELRQIRQRQLAGMSEQELADALRWMGDALTPQELAAFVDDLQTSVDGQTFDCLLDHLRRHTEPARWRRVARELGLPDAGADCGVRPGTAAEGSGPRRDEPYRRAHRADRYRIRAQ